LAGSYSAETWDLPSSFSSCRTAKLAENPQRFIAKPLWPILNKPKSMYKINDTDIILADKMQKQKKFLKSTFQNNFDTQEKTLELFIQGINHAQFNSFTDTKLIWNIAAFINIISFDLKVVSQDLMLAENEWQKRYYSRQVSLIIYESINDFFDLLGKDFRELISLKICDKKVEEELMTVRKDLNSYKSKYFDKLKGIRNTAIAHRDNDSIKQIRTIIDICWSDTIEMVTSYDRILNQLGQIFQGLINIGLSNFEELKKKK